MSKLSLTPNGAGTGTYTLASPNNNASHTLTLPVATGTLLTSTGDGSGLTALTSGNLTGALPAIDGSALTGISSTDFIFSGLKAIASSGTLTIPAGFSAFLYVLGGGGSGAVVGRQDDASWGGAASGGGAGGGGGQIFNIGKSKAKLFDEKLETKTTFKDVAGLEGAKEEIQEIVDFLKHPEK